jgi:hypothetical protein
VEGVEQEWMKKGRMDEEYRGKLLKGKKFG